MYLASGTTGSVHEGCVRLAGMSDSQLRPTIPTNQRNWRRMDDGIPHVCAPRSSGLHWGRDMRPNKTLAHEYGALARSWLVPSTSPRLCERVVDSRT